MSKNINKPCRFTDEQLEVMEQALRDGKRLELFYDSANSIKIKVVTRKDLAYNKGN